MQNSNGLQQPQIDINKTTTIKTEGGDILFQQGVILRKASKFLTNSKEDMLLPIVVFFDPKTNKILSSTVPKELRAELKEYLIEL